MTEQIQETSLLQKHGMTPPKPRYAMPGSMITYEPFRIRVEGVLNKRGVLLYICPHCGNKQAYRPPDWANPHMVIALTTVCCDHPIVCHITGRSEA